MHTIFDLEIHALLLQIMATSEGDKSIKHLEAVWSRAKRLSAVAKCHQKLLVSNYVKLCNESEVFLERATADFLMDCLDNEDIETGAHTEEKVGTGICPGQGSNYRPRPCITYLLGFWP